MKKQELESMVVGIFKEVVKEVENELEFGSNVLKVEFSDNSNPEYRGILMGTLGEYQKNFFSIVSTTSNYHIVVNLDNMMNAIKFIKGAFIFKNKNNRACKAYIRVLALHELRHVWQYEHGFFNGKTDMHLDFLGYGTDDSETDANNFAISRGRSSFETLVGLVNKCQQELSGCAVKEIAKKRMRLMYEYIAKARKAVK